MESHEGGRNVIYIGEKEAAPSYVLRISYQNDRTKEEYLAELEFVHYLAELWVHGSGWIMFEQDEKKRKEFMDFYFAEILKGYRSETSVSDEMVALLPLFVQATRIENLVDAFEVEKSTGENYLDEEDVEEICQCILEESIFC